MGASLSKPSTEPLRKLSAKSKDACVHFHVGMFNERGTFEYDASLEVFMNDQMTPVRVRRCMDPMKSKGFGLSHEYLLVNLLTPENCQLLIKAEKLFIGMKNKNQEAGGLTKVGHIVDLPSFEKQMEKRNIKYEVDLEGSGKILMKDLLNTLRACTPRYSLWEHNCWKYAYDALKKLLEKLAGHPDTSDDCKKNIRKAIKEMPYHTLPAYVLKKTGCVFLVCCAIAALVYLGAAAGIGACKFLKGFKMAQVIGIGGSTLKLQFKSAMVSANASLAKRAWVWCVGLAFVLLPTWGIFAGGCASMQENHCYPRQ